MAAKPSTPVLAKIVGLAVAAAAAWAANQAINQSWQAARGHKPPKAEDPGDSQLAEILVAAALSGAAVAVARALATRGTARFAVKSDLTQD